MAYYVYILTNRSRRPFYTGVTNSIERRTWEHKNDVNDGYTRRYRLHELVYFEEHSRIQHAITREKQIKNMHRAQKMALVLSMNPEWKDLSAEWFVRHRYQPEEPGKREAFGTADAETAVVGGAKETQRS